MNAFRRVLALCLLAAVPAVAAVQPPQAPQAATAWGDGLSGQVQLTWQASVPAPGAGISAYHIYVATPGTEATDLTSAALALTVTATAPYPLTQSATVAVGSANDGVEGAYWITAVDASNRESAAFGPLTACSSIAPAAVTLQSVAVGSYGFVTVTVAPFGDFSTFGVSYISVVAAASVSAPASTTPAAQACIARIAFPALVGEGTLPGCGSVTLTAYAVDTEGVSSTASPAIVLAPLCGPQGVTAGTQADGSVEVQWQAVAGATGYVVAGDSVSLTSGSPPGDPLPIVFGSTTGTSLDVTGVALGASSIYRVYAENPDGTLTASYPSADPPVYTLAAPWIVPSTGAGFFGFTWNAPGVGQAPFTYTVYTAATPTSSAFVAAQSMTWTSFSSATSLAGQWCFVGVTDAQGVSSLQAPPSGGAFGFPTVGVPLLATPTVSDGAVQLAWLPVSGAGAYLVTAGGDTDTARNFSVMLTSTSYADASSVLAGGITTSAGSLSYTVSACAVYSQTGYLGFTGVTLCGAASAQCFVAQPQVPAPLGIALSAAATGVARQVFLEWSQPAYETPPAGSAYTYDIFYSTSGPIAPTAPQVSGIPYNVTLTTLSNLPPDAGPEWFWMGGDLGQGSGVLTGPALASPYAAPSGVTVSVQPLGWGQGTYVLVSPPVLDAPLGRVLLFSSAAPLTPLASVVPGKWGLTLPASALPCGVPVSLTAQAVDAMGDTGGAGAPVWLDPPCAPGVSAAMGASGVLNLAWAAPAGAVSDYQVWGATAPGLSDPLPVCLTPTTSGKTAFSLTPTAGGPSWFRVCALGATPWAAASASSQEIGLLGPVSGVSVAPSAGRLDLSWNAPAAVSAAALTGYEVCWATGSPSGAPPWGLTATVGAGTATGALTMAASASPAVALTGLSDLSPYTVAILPLGAGLTGTAVEATATTGAQGPRITQVTQQALEQTVGNFSLWNAQNLSVTAIGGALTPSASAEYVLYRATDATGTPQTFNSLTPVAYLPASWTALSAGAPVSLSFAAATAPGPAWYFLDLSGTGLADGGADTTNARTLAGAYFAPALSPVAAAASVSQNGRVLLTWNGVPWADTYAVFRSTGPFSSGGTTPAAFTEVGTLAVSPSAATVSAESWLDTAPVASGPNVYQVLASAATSGSGRVYGPAGSGVTVTPFVAPDAPGMWTLPITPTSGIYGAAVDQGYSVTAVATASGSVLLEWTPSGAGSYPISGYNVFRGASAQSLSPLAFADATTFPASLAQVLTYSASVCGYVDKKAAQDLGVLVYGVQALDVSGNVSALVTATVRAATPWPAPLSLTVRSLTGGVYLSWTAGSGIGTFYFKGWQISRIATVGSPVSVVAQASALTQTTQGSWTDLNPPLGSPEYLIQAVDRQGNLGLPLGITVQVSTVNPASVPPAQVVGLTASAALSGSSLGVALSWLPNDVTETVGSYRIRRWTSAAPVTVIATVSSSVTWTPAVTTTAYTDAAGLTFLAGTLLNYQVQALNAAGAGPLSVTLTVPLLPPAPAYVSPLASLPASGRPGPALGLTWAGALSGLQIANGGEYYSVLRQSGSGTSLVGYCLTNTSWADSAPLFAQGVTYTVTSVVRQPGAGWVTSSACALTYVQLPPETLPAAPTNLTAAVSVSGVALAWSPVSGASEYWVYRSSAAFAGEPDPSTLYTVCTSTAAVDPGSSGGALSGATQPYYAVAAAGPFGGTQTAAVGPLAPPPPGVLTATAGGSLNAGTFTAVVALSWTASAAGTPAGGYLVTRTYGHSTRCGPGTQQVTITSQTGYSDSLPSCLFGLPLVYAVTALGPGGVAASPVTATVTAYGVPSPVCGVGGAGTSGGVDCVWTPASAAQGVTGYAVSWSLYGGAVVGVSQVAAAAALWHLGGLNAGQAVSVTVQALNSAGASPVLTCSATVLVALSESAAAALASVSAMSGFAATASGNPYVDIQMGGPSGTSVVLYRSSGYRPIPLSLCAGGPASPVYLTTIAASGTVADYEDASVTAGSVYSYAATAVDSTGLPGGESSPVAAAPLTVAATSIYSAPVLSGTAGAGRVDLWWSPPAYAGTYAPMQGYRLYRSPAASTTSYGLLTALASTESTYSDTQIVSGAQYYYELMAVDARGRESAPGISYNASYEQISYSSQSLIEPPVTISLTAGNGSVTLRWVARESDATAGGLYNVYRRPEFSGNGTIPTYGAPQGNLYHVGPSTVAYPSTSANPITMLVETILDPAGVATSPANLVPVCYAMTVVNGAGEGPKSRDFCTTPFNPLDPAQPPVSNNALTAMVSGTTGVVLNWEAIPAVGNLSNTAQGLGYGVKGYNIYQSSDGGATYSYLTMVAEPVNLQNPAPMTYYYPNKTTGVTYFYRVVPLDTGGNEGQPYSLAFAGIPSGHNELYVLRNSFNPALGETVGIQCGVQASGTYWVKAYTLRGEYVATIIPPSQAQGGPNTPWLSPQVTWDGRNADGKVVASGVYLIHLQAPGYMEDERVAVIK